ncbi:MAG: hypothetical protein FJY81_00265 [Candidatus Aminicenantes bacterium]|nr:hypothetical protein [Candidatus Aminicenantes bacterium]
MTRANKFLLGCGLGAFVLCLILGGSTSRAQKYDIVIKGGRGIDGSGNPWYTADIGLKDGKIAAIAPYLGEGEAVAPYRGIYASHIWNRPRDLLLRLRWLKDLSRFNITSSPRRP